MKACKSISIPLLLGILLAACSTTPQIGHQASEKAPRLTHELMNSEKTVWDDPSAFGPVPPALATQGNAACSAYDTDKVHFVAIGYHPKAENADGTPFLEGGFFCAPK